MSSDLSPPIHPDEPARFRDDHQLHRHVEDHVLNSRDEEWEELLDQANIRQAREEKKRRVWWGPATQELASAYEALAGEELQRACTRVDTHAHYRGYKPHDPEADVRLDSEVTLIGWIDDSRILWIVAGSSVRNSKWIPYYLRSMYRFKREAQQFYRALKVHQKRIFMSERGLEPFDCPEPAGKPKRHR